MRTRWSLFSCVRFTLGHNMPWVAEISPNYDKLWQTTCIASAGTTISEVFTISKCRFEFVSVGAEFHRHPTPTPRSGDRARIPFQKRVLFTIWWSTAKSQVGEHCFDFDRTVPSQTYSRSVNPLSSNFEGHSDVMRFQHDHRDHFATSFGQTSF